MKHDMQTVENTGSVEGVQYTMAFLFLSLFTPSLICAQSTEDIGEVTISPWEATAGVVPTYLPLYDGSDDYETKPYPYVDILYKQRYFISSEDGIGFHLIDDGQTTFGASLNYAIGRKESRRLAGLGEVDSGATVNLFVEITNENQSVKLKMINIVSGDDTGTELELEAAIANKLMFRRAVTASFADGLIMQSYFGVTESQSSSSSFDEYSPSSGITSVGIDLGISYLQTKEWHFLGAISFERLVDNAEKSPIVLDENQFTVSAGVVYRF